ncbi:MAG: arabinan endo-1,5-alpha-L-arabinosidase [Pirellulaceae bacterium]|nr:arabinan endo-1,5-alpha-L-arabinosidase [Planctomycetales bacterium]
MNRRYPTYVRIAIVWISALGMIGGMVPQRLGAQPVGRPLRGATAPKPLYRDPVFSDGKITCDRNESIAVNLSPPRRQPQIHDPSTILKRDDKYYCLATGNGVQAMVSEDLQNWHLLPPVFESPPTWVHDVVPGHRGHFWAPDVIQTHGQYRLYYSVSAFGKRTSAIALATSPTLEPQLAESHWSDQGIVVQTNEESDHNAIDPAIVTTGDGPMWMVYGSFWTGIKLIQLDPTTGKRIADGVSRCDCRIKRSHGKRGSTVVGSD